MAITELSRLNGNVKLEQRGLSGFALTRGYTDYTNSCDALSMIVDIDRLRFASVDQPPREVNSMSLDQQAGSDNLQHGNVRPTDSTTKGRGAHLDQLFCAAYLPEAAEPVALQQRNNTLTPTVMANVLRNADRFDANEGEEAHLVCVGVLRQMSNGGTSAARAARADQWLRDVNSRLAGSGTELRFTAVQAPQQPGQPVRYVRDVSLYRNGTRVGSTVRITLNVPTN
jgi:hypothetical protein